MIRKPYSPIAMVTFSDKEYTLDKHGFLDPPEQWDEDFARGMAVQLGIHEGLSGEHWRFIYYLRKKFLEEKSVPLVHQACRDNRLKLKRLRGLFPAGYLRGACRISGLNFEFIFHTTPWLTWESTPIEDPEHEVTKNGFLEDFQAWNERFAHRVSRNWGLPEGLTDKHWKVFRFMREYFEIHRNIPTIFKTCRAAGLELDEFARLFPRGYHRGACRAAGLPFLA